MKNRILYIIAILFIGFSTSINGQDLLDKLESKFPDKPQYVLATFKTTRISIGHSVETRAKGTLEIAAISRFWNIPNTDTQTFLADKVNTRFSLEYAITDRLTFGGGISTFDGLSDGFLKYRLVKQRLGSKKSPVSITLYQNISHSSGESEGSIYGPSIVTPSTTGFTTQVLIAKKFNPKFSVQIAPTFVHRDFTVWPSDPKNQFALGIGFRHKISGHTSVVSEYYYVANPLKSIDTYNAFSVGVNWELSDLMLQFNITNARNVVEDAFITRTANNFNFHDGNFHFGFNATLVLHFRKNKLK
jgi:hypothetical protein